MLPERNYSICINITKNIFLIPLFLTHNNEIVIVELQNNKLVKHLRDFCLTMAFYDRSKIESLIRIRMRISSITHEETCKDFG